jgi:hypothetical protein
MLMIAFAGTVMLLHARRGETRRWVCCKVRSLRALEMHTLREPDGRNVAGCDVGNARRSSGLKQASRDQSRNHFLNTPQT